ncbi:uncharacterized protein LOC111704711 isoform X1 [Eurytemora carolleeae]|uniref:uncharacterized protein LOC111704711 isoform X1 n=1 Tax=Eurytemora carolleeae TaxID=1294199 RepID=UPI000C78D8C9|nr:uncharacterized protein LOC111704711 isoform X1 [Eurytemora carolleeae]|eukprot:XP_023332801.1 uncharacterized protein LOC111704711 isoform X1 [Eurytemora affinis]
MREKKGKKEKDEECPEERQPRRQSIFKALKKTNFFRRARVEVEEEEVSPVKFSFLGQVYRHAMFTFSRTMTKSYSQSQDNGGGRSNQNSCDLPDGRVEKEESLENPKETKN